MEQAVVIYDGECKFCIRQIAHLRRFDRAGKLRYVSLHDPQVAIDYPDLSYDQLMDQMWVIDPQGGRHGGAYALRYLSRALPLLRCFLKPSPVGACWLGYAHKAGPV
jgi:predicted DCC family thiol-disulfide oxidoreductase YuxK